MKKLKLDAEEQALLQDFESGEFRSVLTAQRKEQLAKAAKQSLIKDKRINIRISSCDLEALQRRALEEGIPYQTLAASILHKYASGGLQDITANKIITRSR